MGCPIRGVILDPIVAMQMGVQGQVVFTIQMHSSILILYLVVCCDSMHLLATNGTKDCNGVGFSCVSVGWNPILGSKDGE